MHPRKSGKVAKNINLAKIFGVENVITPKTLVDETLADMGRKTAGEASDDIFALLMSIEILKNNQDIDGIIKHLNAIQLRLDVMKEIADEIKRRMKG